MNLPPTAPSLCTSDVILLEDVARRSIVTYAPNFLSGAEADTLFATLVAGTPFRAEAPVMFGRAMTVRRRTYAFGDPGVTYHYSGVEQVAAPWPSGLLSVLARVREHVGARFTFALCNLYPDGAAGLGWHADDERDIVTDSPIASLSLGAERDFQMRLGRGGPAVRSVPLAHGSLLVMGGATQRHFQHQVPKRARCTSPRLNLTFRVMR